MVVLVTGGAGYLGRRLVEALLNQGETVRVAIKPGTNSADISPHVQVIVGDLRDPEDAVAAMEGVDRVYHLASLARYNHPEGDDIYLGINRDGTRNLVQAARLTEVQRVVCCIPCLALGPPPEGVESFGAITEELYDWRDHPNFKTEGGPYVRSLRAMDRLLDGFTGVDVIRVYPAFLYGPSAEPPHNPDNFYHELTAFIQRTVQRGRASLTTSLDRQFSTAFMDDVLKGLFAAMEHGQPGAKYILGGEETDWHSVIHLLEEILEKKIRITKPLLWQMVVREKLARTIRSIGFHNSDYQEWSAIARRDWRFSSQKAIAELEYTRTPIKMGVRRTLEWLGYLPEDPLRREA